MRGFLGFLIFVALSASASAADPYPSRPIKLLIPFPPAGITDLSGRIVAEGLRDKLKQPVVVENKPGANGILGLRELLKADADGYTLMVGNVGSLVLNYAIDTKAPFDPMKDVVPIASTAEYATTMVVNKNLPVNSVQEFVAYAKARQGQLTYGSTGEGSIANLSTQLFMQKTGIKMVHAPYKGGPLALNDLIAGHIQLIIEVSPVVNEQVLGGTIKGFAVTSPYRQPMLPNVPTFAEAGVPGVVVTGWLGIYGPPGLPNDVRDKLGKAVVEVVKDPETQKKLRAIGFEPTGQGTRRIHRASRRGGEALGGVLRRSGFAEIAMAEPAAAPVVALHGVRKAFETGTLALDGFDFALRAGEFVSLLGPSGCGKSTALRIVAGLSEPTGGTVTWSDPAARNGIGFVFQEPTLMPWATVFDNVFLPLKLAGESRAAVRERVTQTLSRVGLSDFAAPIRANCPAACACGCRSRARSSPRRAFC